jgi:hypothetical protein
MRESYVEDLASQTAPTMRWRPVRAQRSVGIGVRAGRLLSLEISGPGCRRGGKRRKAILVAAFSRAVIGPRGVGEPVHARDLSMLRTGRSHGHPPVVMAWAGRAGKAKAVIP